MRLNLHLLIDKIYHSFPSLADMKKYGSRNEEELTMWDYVLNLFENDFKEKICILKKDDIIYFDDVKIKILRVYNPNIIHNYTNKLIDEEQNHWKNNDKEESPEGLQEVDYATKTLYLSTFVTLGFVDTKNFIGC